MKEIIKKYQNLKSWLEFYGVHKNTAMYMKTLGQLKEYRKKHNLK